MYQQVLTKNQINMSIPRDPNNNDYVKWFELNEQDEYKKFFNENGFVAVKVLSQEECDKSIDDIWNYLESPSLTSKNIVDRNDPTTWKDQNWKGMISEGILGPRLAFSHCALSIRQHPNVYQVFSDILGTEKIMSNHDRYGLFRPTKDVEFPDGSKKDVTNWKTIPNLHLDGNPWSYVLGIKTQEEMTKNLVYKRHSDFILENNMLGNIDENQLLVQGLVNFMDNRPQDGGFQLVPKFPQRYKEWVESTSDSIGKHYSERQDFIILPENVPFAKEAERISVPAGCLVIWNQQSPHGSLPNNSNRPRFAQFMKFFPAIDINSERGQNRAASLKKILNENEFEPSELGNRIFGLSPYE